MNIIAQQHPDLVTEFVAYSKRVSLCRIRRSQVPDALRPLYDHFMAQLQAQLSDPEEESVSTLPFSCYVNAMQAVTLKFRPATNINPLGNCPRCGGSGLISAYRHIRGGQCLKCEGSGSI